MNQSLPRLVCTILIFALGLSCSIPASARYFRAKGFSASAIDSMIVIPQLNVGIISSGNAIERNDSFSTAARQAHEAVLMKNAASMKIAGLIRNDGPVTDSVLFNEIESLFWMARRQKFLLKQYKLPGIESIGQKRGIRYVMLLHNTGYVRTRANKLNQNVEAAGVGLLTLGMAIPVIHPTASYMRVMIFDLQEHRAVFFNDDFHSMATVQENPASESGLHRQLRALFHPFFPLAKTL